MNEVSGLEQLYLRILRVVEADLMCIAKTPKGFCGYRREITVWPGSVRAQL